MDCTESPVIGRPSITVGMVLVVFVVCCESAVVRCRLMRRSSQGCCWSEPANDDPPAEALPLPFVGGRCGGSWILMVLPVRCDAVVPGRCDSPVAGRCDESPVFGRRIDSRKLLLDVVRDESPVPGLSPRSNSLLPLFWPYAGGGPAITSSVSVSTHTLSRRPVR